MIVNKKLKKYDINQCALYKCSNRRRLESLLNMERYSLEKKERVIKFYSFNIFKDDGTKREINAPRFEAKKIQRRILNLIAHITRPDWVISGEWGKCYIDNAKYHQESSYLLTMDIKRFYDNCQREYVFRFFSERLCAAKDIAGILTDLVTFNGGIPTGCPTSQLLAYYAYEKMFNEISATAKQYGCKFTLYVDDMTFSNNESFNYKRLVRSIDIILRKYGHKPKYSKIEYYSKGKIKIVTGVGISEDHQLLVSNNLQHKIFTSFQCLKKMGKERDRFKNDSIADKQLLKLKGQLQAARSVDKSKFPEINRLVKSQGLFNG